MMSKRKVSPVTVSVIWNGLLSIADEMGGTLRRTAYSEAVREGDDFSTGIFDRHGRLIAQGNFTPGQLGCMPFIVERICKDFPVETLRPGDEIYVNDSAIGSGHYPDCFLIAPVFKDDKHVGYVANIAHQVDVGGAAPGSQKVKGVTEAYQEGIRILPVKIVKEGELDEDLVRLILGNVRLPEIFFRDFQAQRNANYVGARRYCALIEEYGEDTLLDVVETYLADSEQRMRDAIKSLPDGNYSFDDCLEDCGPAGEPVNLGVDVKIDGDEITVDFSRSDKQVEVAINSYFNYTRAYTYFAIKVLSGVSIPQNHGVVRPIKVAATPGTFFNPTFPAPSAGRATVQIRIFELINGALAKALPHCVLAGFSHWSNPNLSGIDERTGKVFIYYDFVMGGYGARSSKDGTEALAPVFNCVNIPVEVHETNNPVRIHRFGFIADSGGGGKYRGGCGVRKDVELLAEKARITLLSDRHVNGPYGLQGGEAGKTGRTLILRDGEEIDLTSKAVAELRRNDIISFRLSGGGGFGDPGERSQDDTNRDLQEGYTTPE